MMLRPEERQSKLENLLRRVQKNRRHLAAPRSGTAPEPAAESTPEPVPEVNPAPTPDPTAAGGLEAIVMEEVSSRPPSAEETVKRIEATPRASGDVAAASGTPERSWTLDAVLARAWKLGSV